MKAMQSVGLFMVALLLTGCGQKYPQSYGLYIRSGQGWTPLDTSKPCTISEKPEFLVFDARLAQASDKPDATITLRPMKWIRWNINALVAQRDAVPRVYQKTKAGTFLPSESSQKMMYSPVKNHRDMLQVTPATPLANGYFVLDAFGERVICRIGVTENPNDLPDEHIVDKWSVSHDEKSGFSWDAFLAASVNQGRAVLNEGFEPPQKLTALLETLRQDLASLVSARSTPAILAFCQRVEKLDSDLYASARKECFTVIEYEIAEAKSNRDLPTALGIGSMATNAGFASETILEQIGECARDLSAIETAAAGAIREIMADMTNEGSRGKVYQLDHYLSLKETSVAVESSHIFYSSKMLAYPEEKERLWMGNIAAFSKVEDRSVNIDADYPRGRRDKFTSVDDQNAFFAAASEAFAKWKEKWRNRLTVEVTARPHYWSERVFVGQLPYAMDCVAGTDAIVVADVELGTDDATASRTTQYRRFDGNAKSYNMGQSWGNPAITGQFRVKSVGPNPVKLRVRLCPAIWPEEKRD